MGAARASWFAFSSGRRGGGGGGGGEGAGDHKRRGGVSRAQISPQAVHRADAGDSRGGAGGRREQWKTRRVGEGAPIGVWGGIGGQGRSGGRGRGRRRAISVLERAILGLEPENERARVAATADVDVDCAGFDRALAWLEAESLGRAHPEYDIRVVESMAATAETLGLRSLADACAARLGTHASRVRVRRWADITAHNDAGGAWLVVDGMVLDVKRWLPEHPGGDKIIPAQSLRADAARHFELYHSSRESFLYLKHFYVGEVFADDRASVPLVPGPPASDDFLQQLREYTEDFRVDAAELPEENVRAHLGARGK